MGIPSVNLELQVFLQSNNDLWDLKDKNKISSDSGEDINMCDWIICRTIYCMFMSEVFE